MIEMFRVWAATAFPRPTVRGAWHIAFGNRFFQPIEFMRKGLGVGSEDAIARSQFLQVTHPANGMQGIYLGENYCGLWCIRKKVYVELLKEEHVG